MTINNVTSPITGSIWKIEIALGQKVSAGETAIVLESMKAEFTVEAPFSGTVKDIKLSEGDVVYENDVIFTIEVDN